MQEVGVRQLRIYLSPKSEKEEACGAAHAGQAEDGAAEERPVPGLPHEETLQGQPLDLQRESEVDRWMTYIHALR